LKIANATPEGVTVISNDEFNHYSNLIVCLTTISHRFDRGPSVSRSSFQRACARIGPTILGHSPRNCQAVRLGCSGGVPSERERNDTEGRFFCQPPFPRFFFFFRFGPVAPRHEPGSPCRYDQTNHADPENSAARHGLRLKCARIGGNCAALVLGAARREIL
jgi:hypothetical protein